MGLDDLDGAAWAGGSCEAPVAGEQGRLECFGEGNVGGVVDGEIVPMFPTAPQQRGVLDALEWQFLQVVKSKPDPARVQVAAACQAAPHRGHFEVDQCGCGELFTAQPVPHCVTVLAVIEKGDGQDAGVNDEHDRTATCLPRRPVAAIRRRARRPWPTPRPASVGRLR